MWASRLDRAGERRLGWVRLVSSGFVVGCSGHLRLIEAK